MSDKCIHDLAEQETACADGFCPICATVNLLDVKRELAEARADARAEIVRLKGKADLWEGGFDRACDHLAEIRDQRDKAIAFLHAYRNDTPLGHQPHMLAHEVDQFLKESGE